ncbi:MAG: hypothetical protein LBO07_06780 [Coriobacteriales bacterium]|jgi:X-X-X-Leu-X-X-Gly heptad repeat protein|nr:hypothetical protein [Coriobacteriales bacterium]
MKSKHPSIFAVSDTPLQDADVSARMVEKSATPAVCGGGADSRPAGTRRERAAVRRAARASRPPRRTLAKALCMALALLLVGGLVPALAFGPTSTSAQPTALVASTSAGEEARIAGKDEVIYATLGADGTLESTYVVNHFEVLSAGSLRDEGSYTEVLNLSTTETLSHSGEEVRAQVDVGDFYYQGAIADAALPWLVSISYTLDGAVIDAEALAGASGNLEIRIDIRKNPSVDPLFFDNYALQIQLALDTGKARELKAPDATIAQAGAMRQVAFTVLPGKEADLNLSAQVTDFEMDAIQISALPFSMAFDLPDTSEMTDELTTLSDALAQLDEGVAELQSGVFDMKDGASGLASGSADLNEGLKLLSGNSAGLTGASAQIEGALAAITAQLEAGMIDPAQLTQLIGGLRQLAAGLASGDLSQPGLAEGLAQVQGGLSSATAAMDGQIAALVPVTDGAAIETLWGEALVALSQDSQYTVGQLLIVNERAAYVYGTWYGPGTGEPGVKAGLESLAAGLGDSVASCELMAGTLSEIATGLEQGLGELAGLQTLATYLGQLSDNYAAFHRGLATYAGGVDAIAGNYQTFNDGLAQFSGGVGELYGGISDLRDGTNELRINTADLPEQVREQIDEFMEDYSFGDFAPRSFVSSENAEVDLVQFVLRTEPIKAPEVEKEAEAIEEPGGFWDRILSLFS